MGVKYRAVGVCLTQLSERGVEQETLFESAHEEMSRSKAEHIADVIDSVRSRYGDGALVFAPNISKAHVREHAGGVIHAWAYPHLGFVR